MWTREFSRLEWSLVLHQCPLYILLSGKECKEIVTKEELGKFEELRSLMAEKKE